MLFKDLFKHENLNKKLKCYMFENSRLFYYQMYNWVKLVLMLEQIEFN